MMSTSRAHYVLPSKASQENRVKKKAKQITRDQHSAENPNILQQKSLVSADTPRIKLGDISNVRKSGSTNKIHHKPKRKKFTSKTKVETTCEKEYMPDSEPINDSEFLTEFVPPLYFSNLISAIRNTSILPEIAEMRPMHLPSLTVETLETRPIYVPDADVTSMELPPVDLPDIPDIPDLA